MALCLFCGRKRRKRKRRRRSKGRRRTRERTDATMQTCDPRSAHPQTRGNGLRVPLRIDGVAMKLAIASKRPLHQGQSVKASSMTRLQKTKYHNGQWPECRNKSAHTSPIHGASTLGRVSERPSVMTAPCKSMRQEDQRFAWTSLQINLQASESAIGHRGILPKWGLVPRPLACKISALQPLGA